MSCASYYCLKPFEGLKLRQHVVSIKKTAEVIGLWGVQSLAVQIEFLVTTGKTTQQGPSTADLRNSRLFSIQQILVKRAKNLLLKPSGDNQIPVPFGFLLHRIDDIISRAFSW
jgi:hypothetical protein